MIFTPYHNLEPKEGVRHSSARQDLRPPHLLLLDRQSRNLRSKREVRGYQVLLYARAAIPEGYITALL